MNDQLILWLGAINITVFGLLTHALLRFHSGWIKWAFVALLVGALAYANPLLLFWHPAFDIDARLLIARLVFAGALFLCSALTAFIIAFCDAPGRISEHSFYCVSDGGSYSFHPKRIWFRCRGNGVAC
jgi:hypothetical protein